MTVAELIEILGEMPEDAEVRLAFQPSWPFEYEIGAVVEVKIEGEQMVYLGEKDQIGYLPGKAASALGWSDCDDEDEDDEDELESVTEDRLQAEEDSRNG